MTALASLKGVWCAPCRRKGHRCQAQMWVEDEGSGIGDQGPGKIALCLRCADGEACHFEVAASMELSRWADEIDLCAVPAMTAEDRAALKGKTWTHVTAEMKAAALEDLKTMKVQAVAEKHGVSGKVVSGWSSGAMMRMHLGGDQGQALDPAVLYLKRHRAKQASVRVAEPIAACLRAVSSERLTVDRKSALPERKLERCFGKRRANAEASARYESAGVGLAERRAAKVAAWSESEAAQQRASGKREAGIAGVMEWLAARFGVSVEELRRSSIGGDRTLAHRRAVAILVTQGATGALSIEVGKAFGLGNGCVPNAKYIISANPHLRGEIKKLMSNVPQSMVVAV